MFDLIAAELARSRPSVRPSVRMLRRAILSVGTCHLGIGALVPGVCASVVCGTLLLGGANAAVTDDVPNLGAEPGWLPTPHGSALPADLSSTQISL